jgi:hypothetical protein
MARKMGTYSDGMERAEFWSNSSRAARVLGVSACMHLSVRESNQELKCTPIFKSMDWDCIRHQSGINGLKKQKSMPK